MTFKKPQVTIQQNYSSKITNTDNFLPSVLLGPRYNVKEETYLAEYDKTKSNNYEYPGQESLSIIDLDYTKLIFKECFLNYYNSVTQGALWKKIGMYSNKIRTVLASNLIFKTDPDEEYPHSAIFKDRGVKVGDRITIDGVSTTVAGFEYDKSSSSIDTAVAGQGNQATQSNLIGVPTPGPNTGDAVVTTNTGESWTGDLYNDILEDTYKVTVMESGTDPVISYTKSTASLPDLTLNSVFDAPAADKYTIKIIATDPDILYIIYSDNSDNSGPFEFPATGVETDLGSKGTTFTRDTTGAFAVNDYFEVSATPSTARLKIETTSGKDQTSSRVFPGFDYQFLVSNLNLKLSIASVAGLLVKGDYYTIECRKQIAAVTATSGGTFTGPVDINYIVKVIQGGVWGEAIVKVISTYSDTNSNITVAAHSTAYSIGSYGATISFATNAQGGLVLGDIFTVPCTASKNIGYKTIVTTDNLSDDLDEVTKAVSYTGASGDHNTCAISGTYITTNPGLELYNKEIYTVTVTTTGAYGTAKILITSLSGYDSITTPVTVPTTPGDPIDVLQYGLILSFTGAETFAAGNVWTIEVYKESLPVQLYIPVSEVEIDRARVENVNQTAWEPTLEHITINSNLKLFNDGWDDNESLYIDSALAYVTYRCLHTVDSNKLVEVSDDAGITAALGAIHKDNPIAYGAMIAIRNSNGSVIRCAYPANNDLDSWTSLLNKLEVKTYDSVYRLGLLTFDSSILDMAKSHVDTMSAKNKWRDMYICRQVPATIDVVNNATATVKKNSSTDEYTIMRGVTATFSQVQTGDTIYYLDETYTVVKVNTPTELEFTPAMSAEQTVPTNIRISHTLTVQESAEQYVSYGAHYNSKRVISVCPDECSIGTESVPGYYLVAAILGLKASVVPHQPITNYDLSYITSVPDCLYTYSDTQLDTIANGGTLIVAQDNDSDAPYIRHQVSTKVDDIRDREISIFENFDNICYGILAIAKRFIGKYNIHPGVLAQVETDISAYLFSKTSSSSETAGPAILDYKINSISQNEEQEDKIDIDIRIYLPSPLNYMDITLTV